MHRSVILSAALGALTVSAPLQASMTRVAAKIEQALAKGKSDRAVAEAEAAVAAAPADPALRHLLGRAYLGKGRYRAAATSFADALRLDPARANSALGLALVRIGLGEIGEARALIEAQGEALPAGDRGLALALAGDAPAGVALLEADVRAGGADARVRQNLALAYGLAGRWAEAKLMASYDLPPAELSQRIMDWSRIARDGGPASHVAALLGTPPGVDPGQPERLALVPTAAEPVAVALAPPPPPPLAMPADVPAPVPPRAELPSPEPAVVRAAKMQIQFAPRPVTTAKPVASTPPRARPPLAPRPSGGRYVVQIGAYDRAAVAEAAWTRWAARTPLLRDLTPSTATVARGATRLTRLSVAGFATRDTAAGFCQAFRVRGGHCFVRLHAGDAPLQWARRSAPVRLASRA